MTIPAFDSPQRPLAQQTRADLAAAGLAPNHRLGQNFMVDPQARERVLRCAALTPGQRVLEVGPGTGILTAAMLDAGAEVCAVELDRGLHAFLQQRFAAAIAQRQLLLHHADALAGKSALHPCIEAWTGTGPWMLLANLPYDIAIPLLLNVMSAQHPAQRAVVTVQYEAAQRLVSQPGSASWGATAALAQAAGQGQIVARFPGRCFFPQPRVESALLCWQIERALPPGFPLWCRSIFAYRRKVLARALRNLGLSKDDALAILAYIQADPASRLEQLSVSELLALYAAYQAQRSAHD